MFNFILTITVFLPAFAALLLLFLKDRKQVVQLSILSSIVTFVLTVALFILYDKDKGGIQFIDHLNWIDSVNIKSSYLLGLDGLSAPLVLLT